MTDKPTIQRLPDWEDRLIAFLAAQDEARFVWGELDCATFVADAVLATTGVDIAAPFRGKYKTAAGSVRVLRKAGFEFAADVFSSHFEEVPPALARRGDPVLCDAAMGLCIGRDALLLTEDDPAFTRRPMIQWTRAWRVPFAE